MGKRHRKSKRTERKMVNWQDLIDRMQAEREKADAGTTGKERKQK